MPFVAVRLTHIPHRVGADEAASRGHGPVIRYLAGLVASWNSIIDIYNFDGRDAFIRALDYELWLKCGGSCDVNEIQLLLEKVGDDLRRRGFRVLWGLFPNLWSHDYDAFEPHRIPFIVVEDGPDGSLLLGVDISPRDQHLTLHFIFVRSDLAAGAAVMLIPIALDKIYEQDWLDGFIEGCTEVIYDYEKGERKAVFAC